jgi:membrane associated rhomboid family serine protease
MDRLLARLERRFGKYAVENLTVVIVGGMAAVFVVGMMNPRFLELLVLDLEQVKRGQVWRLFTYLFLPTSGSMLWILLSIYWVWLIGSNLEAEWGAFKFNVYYLVGMLGTTAAAWLVGGGATNEYLNHSLFFAFATLFPDFEIFLFFLLRIKVKWLALLDAGYLALSFFEGSSIQRAAIVAALLNYFLFFSGTLWALLRSRNLQVRQAARRASLERPPRATGGRTCAICGKSEDDGADIRVCSCAKCGGPRTLCLEHARNH